MLIPRIALPAVAFSTAAPTFSRVASARTQFRALDSRLRRCASGHVANPNCSRDVGTEGTYWVVTLACLAGLPYWNRRLPADGLRLLVVALGEPYDSNLLAIS